MLNAKTQSYLGRVSNNSYRLVDKVLKVPKKLINCEVKGCSRNYDRFISDTYFS